MECLESRPVIRIFLSARKPIRCSPFGVKPQDYKPRSHNSTPIPGGNCGFVGEKGLHIGVSRAFASLWHHPIDVLRRILDVAGLAMHAVLRIDLQARLTFLVTEDFIDAGWAKALFR